MNPSDIKTLKDFSTEYKSDWEITKKIQEEGWRLIAVRIERTDPQDSEHLIYTLGHTDENPGL